MRKYNITVTLIALSFSVATVGPLIYTLHKKFKKTEVVKNENETPFFKNKMRKGTPRNDGVKTFRNVGKTI